MRLFERIGSGDTTRKKVRRHDDCVNTVVGYLKKNELSTIPGVISKIGELARNPAVGAKEYAKVCEADQSSCMRLLRMANSVLYGARDGKVIRTVKDAIVRIGFDKAQDVIHSSVVSSLFKTKDRIGEYSAPALWMNSVAVAAGCRFIYTAVKTLPRPDIDPYLAGLLHNIGIPLLHLCFLNEGFSDALNAKIENNSLLEDEEKKLIGIGHQEAGMEVAKWWRLQDELTAVIGHHHDMEVEDEDIEMLVHVCRVSEWMALELELGYSDFGEAQVESYAVSLGKVMLDDTLYERVKKDVSAEVDRMKELGWFSGLGVGQSSGLRLKKDV